MKADFAAAASDLATDGHAAGYLATVDATEERALGGQYEVRDWYFHAFTKHQGFLFLC